VFTSRYPSQQVFNGNQALMFRLLTYDYGRRPECEFPSRWNDNKIAGIDWLQGFMKSRKNRALCKPENTILFVASAFIKTKGMEFFENYERELKSWEFTADRAYNTDEAGVPTVVRSPNIFAQLETKQVGQAVSGE
jgi:hypothetical protein